MKFDLRVTFKCEKCELEQTHEFEPDDIDIMDGDYFSVVYRNYLEVDVLCFECKHYHAFKIE